MKIHVKLYEIWTGGSLAFRQCTPADNTRKRVWLYIEKEKKKERKIRRGAKTIDREYKNLFGVCGGRRRKTVNVPFLIPQRVHKVPFLIIQRVLDVPFFYKVTVPFFVPGVNTTSDTKYFPACRQ